VARPKRVVSGMNIVRAHAIVDSVMGSLMRRVKVWDDHLGQTRFYDIEADTESEAAMEGLRRFREEMEAPLLPTNEEGV
jgi:hypothetical protein